MTLTAYYHKMPYIDISISSVLVSSTCSQSECLCDNVDISHALLYILFMTLEGMPKGLARNAEMTQAVSQHFPRAAPAARMAKALGSRKLVFPHVLASGAGKGQVLGPAWNVDKTSPARHVFFLKCRHLYPVALSVPPRASQQLRLGCAAVFAVCIVSYRSP
jgi:hypothetical protein